MAYARQFRLPQSLPRFVPPRWPRRPNPCGLPPAPQPAKPIKTGYKVTEIAKGLDHPWSIAFLPDGSMLVTERPGRLRVMHNGALDPTPISGVPPVYTQAGAQAGLFDVVLHPKFAENHIIYLTFATGTHGANATRVVRAHYDGHALTDVQPIFTAVPTKDTGNHYGGRMVFIADGTFLLTVGEGFEYREKAQDLRRSRQDRPSQ